MMQEKPLSSPSIHAGHFLRTGAIAGAISVLVFTVIHHILISDIWFSFPIMVAAGVACGVCIGWNYQMLFERPTIGAWLRYNLLYSTLFLLLGVASVLLFEPVTTMAAVIAANEPPEALITQALPLSLLFIPVAAGVASLLFDGRTWRKFGALLLTWALLTFLLGLNVSVLGLVDIPRGGWFLVAEFFGLILLLNAVYAATVIVLEKKALS